MICSGRLSVNFKASIVVLYMEISKKLKLLFDSFFIVNDRVRDTSLNSCKTRWISVYPPL